MSINTANLDNAIAALETAAAGGSRVTELMAKSAASMTAEEKAELAGLLTAPASNLTTQAVGALSNVVEPLAKSMAAAPDASVDATQFILGLKQGFEQALRVFGEGLEKSQKAQGDGLAALAAGMKVVLHNQKAVVQHVEGLAKSVNAWGDGTNGGPIAADPKATPAPTTAGAAPRTFGQQPAGPSKAAVVAAMEQLQKSGADITAADFASFETSGKLRKSVQGLVHERLGKK